MTLSNQINALPENLSDGSAGHLENHTTIHLALKSHERNMGILSGTGSPLGKVSPRFVGDRYVDIAKTDGAEEWRATGTNNGDWKVSIGNTGWRDISGYLANGWTGKLLALRTATSLEFVCENLNGLNATSASVSSILPAGFFPLPTQGYVRRILTNSAGAPVRIAIHPGRYLTSSRYGNNDAVGLLGGFTTNTETPWGPLPGTAANL